MAITTEVAVANLALSRIGQGSPITSLSASNAAAVACNRVFALVRRELLEEHWWKFATRRAVLVESAATRRAEWGYVYELPADLVVARFVNAGARDDQVPRDGRIPFTREVEAAGDAEEREVLLTDVAPVTAVAPELVYTFDRSTVAGWPAYFADAVAWRLAAEVCLPLAVKADRARLAFDLAAQQLNAAIAKDQRGVQADPEQESEFITARG